MVEAGAAAALAVCCCQTVTSWLNCVASALICCDLTSTEIVGSCVTCATCVATAAMASLALWLVAAAEPVGAVDCVVGTVGTPGAVIRDVGVVVWVTAGVGTVVTVGAGFVWASAWVLDVVIAARAAAATNRGPHIRLSIAPA